MSNAASQNVVRLRDSRSGEIVDQVARTVSSMADQLNESVHAWGTKVKLVAKNTDGFVRTSPWQAVGVIALAGLAMGLLVSYSARSRRRGTVNRADQEHDYDESEGG